MKALILTTSLGQGHNSAARAISKCFTGIGVDNVVLDMYEYIDPNLKEAASAGYIFSINSLSIIRGLASDIYDLNEKREEVGDFSFSKLQALVLASELKKLIYQYEPDVIICTQVYAAQVVSLLKEKGAISCLSIGVITDYTVQIYWADTLGLDYVVVPSGRLSYQLAQRGIAQEKMLPTGIPIDPKFEQKLPKREARLRLGLQPEKKTLLVMGGSMGFGNIDKAVCALDRCDLSFQSLVVCGNNQRLYHKMKKIDTGHRTDLYGFSDQIDLMMDAADVILTKPGGITSSEALAKGLPMITFDPIPGMEERNAEFLLNNGVALNVTKTFPVDEAIHLLFSSPHRMRQMRESVEILSRPRAAMDLCEFCARLVGHKELPGSSR